ncbi:MULTISPECIES: fimbria/pilus periplasmic chaperone [Stenotrophomonas]|uniref:fimbrial biogenesis chaperone n=1 Tax=Stenotrophomonas TaxID=40323 RepID=UPI0012FE114E|nr:MULTISPECIES: fimbria/pilus periplasmic chaperone [Stenotrophomonas]MBN5158148.1 molecular chaperone [Stenotrophomonas maltophilia]MDG9842801.1 fimbria/pilus periplasmic chaperone [Stenotrophomonas sp. GD04054]MDH0015586.1 fimbria/pilus periplasmic chaperone [Stenotrophomonas sp. GD04028]MDH0575346.1 fimbria/pilus periplasmic chaperone [Stenotrophomonas sp. GD03997]MDH0858909.1 fimbria/pilus periplasmic chaperone [Stenotrophomonas sp. GD03882]
MLKRSLVVPLFLLWTAPAWAGNVSLFPTSIVAPALEKAAAVTLENHGETPERFQVTVLDWSQDPSGQDVTGPAKAVIAAPSIVEIPPGSRRAVRLVRTQGVGTPGYYRVLLRQLPQPSTAGQVQLLIHQNLPVGFEDAKAGPPVLTARLTANGLLLTNTGSTAARLTAVGPQGMPAWREGALGWVLPGQSKHVELKPGLKASTLSITVNGAPVVVPVN